MTKATRALENIVEALDEAIVEDDTVAEVATTLGIDIPALADRVRSVVLAAGQRTREMRFQEARRGYAEALDRLERRPARRGQTREERLTTFRALLARAPRGAVAMHFHKFDTASDEELEELIIALEHLLENDG